MPSPDWAALERYARWRRNMRWHTLPDDIVTLVLRHLTNADVCALVAAVAGDPRADPHAVPEPMRPAWVRCEVCRAFTAFVKDHVADEVLHDTRDPYTSTAMILDWSCFSNREPNVVAEFSWRRKRACIRVHEERLMWEARTHLQRGLSVVRATLHRVVDWNGSRILNPEPVEAIEYVLIPPGLVC